jgi:uncharacterized protein (DUF2249 family)
MTGRLAGEEQTHAVGQLRAEEGRGSQSQSSFVLIEELQMDVRVPGRRNARPSAVPLTRGCFQPLPRLVASRLFLGQASQSKCVRIWMLSLRHCLRLITNHNPSLLYYRLLAESPNLFIWKSGVLRPEIRVIRLHRVQVEEQMNALLRAASAWSRYCVGK